MAAARNTADVLGIAHVGGAYNLNSSQDYLNQGADTIATVGSRVIKVWLTGSPASNYPFNASEYSLSYTTVTQVAQSAPYARLFQKNFSTFILEVDSVPQAGDDGFSNGFTATEYAHEKQQIYDLTVYLLNTYRNTNKTFVLQNWEGDWKLDGNYTSTAFDGMKRYFTARQEAVNAARAAIPNAGVTVLHAAEVNLVQDAMNGLPRASNMVLPYLNQSPYLPADLYSYSVWDIDPANSSDNPARILQGLDYLAQQTGASRNRIYLGEFGLAENHAGSGDAQLDAVRRETQAALAWGVRYLIYWEVFSNRDDSGQIAGWWIVRPDGTQPPVWSYFADLLVGAVHRVTLTNVESNRLLTANGGGGAGLRADATWAGQNETFLLTDLNGGAFLYNDRVSIQASNGMYVAAENGGGSDVNANRWARGAWENFGVQDNVPSDGVITSSDHVAFTAIDGISDLHAYSPSDLSLPGAVRADAPHPSSGYIPFEQLWVVQFLD